MRQNLAIAILYFSFIDNFAISVDWLSAFGVHGYFLLAGNLCDVRPLGHKFMGRCSGAPSTLVRDSSKFFLTYISPSSRKKNTISVTPDELLACITRHPLCSPCLQLTFLPKLACFGTEDKN